MSEIFDKEVTSGKSYQYADEYVTAKFSENLDESEARLKAGMVEQELRSGRSCCYTYEYVKLRIKDKMEERQARNIADVYERLVSMGVKTECAEGMAKLMLGIITIG